VKRSSKHEIRGKTWRKALTKISLGWEMGNKHW
jgi:urease accessory protein UreE